MSQKQEAEAKKEQASTEERALEQNALSLHALARALKITTIEKYRDACQLELNIKGAIKKTGEFFKPAKSKSYEAWKEICNLEKQVLNRLEEALEAIVESRKDFERKQEERRLAAERKAQEEKVLEAKADAATVAAMLRESDEEELAKQVEENIVVPTVVIKSEIPAIKGIFTKKIPQYRVKDARLVKREFLMLNDSAIRKIVKDIGKEAEKVVGGIEVYYE